MADSHKLVHLLVDRVEQRVDLAFRLYRGWNAVYILGPCLLGVVRTSNLDNGSQTSCIGQMAAYHTAVFSREFLDFIYDNHGDWYL